MSIDLQIVSAGFFYTAVGPGFDKSLVLTGLKRYHSHCKTFHYVL